MQREVMMTGIGGQGIQLASKVLALAAIAEDKRSMLLGHYDGAMRGGQTDASVVIAEGELRALPILERAWSAMVMHGDFWPATRDKVVPGGVIVTNRTLVTNVERPDCSVFEVDAINIANGVGAKLGAGLVLLAAYCAITDIVTVDSLITAMHQVVPPYRTQHLVTNEAALRAGDAAVERGQAPAWTNQPAPAHAAPPRQTSEAAQ